MAPIKSVLYALIVLPWVRKRTPVRDDWAGEWHHVKVTEVYDGDTITVEVYRHGHWLVSEGFAKYYDGGKKL